MGKRSHKSFRGSRIPHNSPQAAKKDEKYASCRFCDSRQVVLQDTIIGRVCKKDACLDKALELLKQRFPVLHLPLLRSGDLKSQASAKNLQSLREQLIRLVQNNEPVGDEYIKKLSAMIDYILIFAQRTRHNFQMSAVAICRQAAITSEKRATIIQQLGALPKAA
ncbi:MAG: hypothetical protein M0Q92_00505 [Methanoregula sp.]|jgi:hypothetical protein|nr:hypothetical protein [Methanoregula sp.]